MHNVSFLKILTKLFVPSKELEGKSINHHKCDIKMNHTELWNVDKIIWLQDKKEKKYFELRIVYLQLPIYNNSEVYDLCIFV
jgi:hypothetical protein